MASALYNSDILRLATSIAHLGRLDHPDATADRRSPTCGSRVIADIAVDSAGRVSDLGLDVRACALGQASAALMSAHAIGRSAAELRTATEALRRFLTTEGNADDAFWPGMAVLGPARAYPARHASILLAFEAVSEAAARALDTRRGAA